MAQPIYKIFMGRFLEAWYQLSKEEQNNLIANLNEALEKNIEAVQEFTAALQELNWFRYCESTNVLGTKSES